MNRRDAVRVLLGIPGAALLAPVPPRKSAVPAIRELRLLERWSWAMGQAVHLQLYASAEDQGYEAAAAALVEVRRVEARLSLFDDASDLTELNRHAGRRAMRADADLLQVLRIAGHIKARTAGAFDPAVEPLLEAWGFRAPRADPPSPREIAAARAAVRAARITITGNRVTLPSREAALDFGGIGVGYGIDRMAAVLRRHGIRHALLDVSGDMLAMGAPPGEAGWRVALAEPDGRPPRTTVMLRDAALATSANTVQTRRYGALVVGHVMDPREGTSAAALRQVSVVAPRAILADAHATAALAGGYDAASAGVRVVRAWR